MRIVRGVLMLLWLLAVVPAAAQEAKPEDKKVETQQVDPVVVTATTVATPATQLGVALSVVTENDFRTYHYATWTRRSEICRAWRSGARGRSGRPRASPSAGPIPTRCRCSWMGSG